MFNNKSMIYWASFCLLVFFSFVIYAGLWLYKDAEESAYKSCILSLKDVLIKTIKDDEAIRQAIEMGQEWRTLNKSETEMIINSPGNSQGFDCKNYPASKRGEGVQIAIRRIDGRIEMQLQINGRIDPSL